MQALPSSDLPPPKSGSYSELSFRRLLKSCDEIAAGDTKGREELQDWQHSPVFFQVCKHKLGQAEELNDRDHNIDQRVGAQYTIAWSSCIGCVAVCIKLGGPLG